MAQGLGFKVSRVSVLGGNSLGFRGSDVELRFELRLSVHACLEAQGT